MRKILLTLALLMASTTYASAQSQRVWIAEFATTRPEAAAPFAQLPPTLKQPIIDISGGISKRSAAFTSQTRYIRIVCEVQCAISPGAVATAGDILLPALKPEYFGVTAGSLVSIIAAP